MSFPGQADRLRLKVTIRKVHNATIDVCGVGLRTDMRPKRS
jgi:hypothetical protein